MLQSHLLANKIGRDKKLTTPGKGKSEDQHQDILFDAHVIQTESLSTLNIAKYISIPVPAC